VSLERPVAPAAKPLAARETSRERRASERRIKRVQPFSIGLVEFKG
jgi:hypothetical protein